MFSMIFPAKEYAKVLANSIDYFTRTPIEFLSTESYLRFQKENFMPGKPISFESALILQFEILRLDAMNLFEEINSSTIFDFLEAQIAAKALLLTSSTFVIASIRESELNIELKNSDFYQVHFFTANSAVVN